MDHSGDSSAIPGHVPTRWAIPSSASDPFSRQARSFFRLPSPTPPASVPPGGSHSYFPLLSSASFASRAWSPSAASSYSPPAESHRSRGLLPSVAQAGPYYSAIEDYDQASENVECAQDELRWPTAAPLPWELAQPAADDAFPVLSTLSYERRAIYDNQGYYLDPPAPGPESTEQASPNSIQSKRRRLSNEAPDAGKRYGCDFPGCVSRFARSSSLAIHKRHHTGAKPFVCPVCQRPFSVMSNLRRHQKTVHQNPVGASVAPQLPPRMKEESA